MYCFRERDRILDLFEELTGSRFHYNTHTVGGQRHDLPAGWDGRAREVLALIEQRLPEYEAMTVHNRIFVDRTRGVGHLDAGLAQSLGITGPILRASGVAHDLRVDAPYHAYDEVKVDIVTAAEGDCMARCQVRLGEVRASIAAARKLLDGLPEGPICGYKPVKNAIGVKIPTGQVYAALESPRGELGTFAIAGGTGTSPYRLKIRAPSLHALSAMPYILPGHTVSDAVAILGSLDPIMGEVDR
jgi:NADH-quinone oxidoreductase subunit D